MHWNPFRYLCGRGQRIEFLFVIGQRFQDLEGRRQRPASKLSVFAKAFVRAARDETLTTGRTHVVFWRGKAGSVDWTSGVGRSKERRYLVIDTPSTLGGPLPTLPVLCHKVLDPGFSLGSLCAGDFGYPRPRRAFEGPLGLGL